MSVLLAVAALFQLTTPGQFEKPEPKEPVNEKPPDKAAAASLVDLGNKLFGNRNFEGALEHFQRAHARYPSPKILLNIAETLRALERPVQAVRAYERFLAEHNAPNDTISAKVQERIESLSPQIGRLTVQCMEPISACDSASIMVDGEPMGAPPLPPTATSPGIHQVEVNSSGHHPFEEMVKIGKGNSTKVQVKLQPFELTIDPTPDVTASQVSTTPPATPLLKRWWFWAGIAAVAVGIGVGVGVGLSVGGDDFIPGGELGRTRTDQWDPL